MNERVKSGLRNGFPDLIAVILAVVLGWAGVAKALDSNAFAQSVENFRVVSQLMAQIVAYYVPWLEIALAIGLLVPRWRVSAAWLVLLLLCGFTALLVSAQWRGLNIQCGCFGDFEERDSLGYVWLYLRNGAFMAMMTFLLTSRMLGSYYLGIP